MPPYYHVFIVFRDKRGRKIPRVEFNRDEQEVKQRIANPYMKNQAFLFLGKIIHPSDIVDFEIFISHQNFTELVLPDGKSPTDEGVNIQSMMDCFRRLKVKDVAVATSLFITSAPKEREELRKTPIESLGEKKKVFIVHGRDEKPALRLQKYLIRKLGLDAEMFEDFKEESSSNTIIEQLEFVRDNVGYAFIVVTPDDVGCLRKNIEECRTKMLIGKEKVNVETVCEILDKLQTRARQNVVFEHGLFIGALGRDRVCCLLQSDTVERPSDTDGILYVGFDESAKETFTEITEKLRKVELVKA